MRAGDQGTGHGERKHELSRNCFHLLLLSRRQGLLALVSPIELI
jgi:hypothetical protein